VTHKDLVKKQFDQQAAQFSTWIGTNSETILNYLFDFIGFSADDRLLDVACGSGNFAAFCAQRIASASGVDISPKMIALAQTLVSQLTLANLTFSCQDVAQLPFAAGRFSVVTCRSAFHHLADYAQVFQEMVRCCTVGGLVCINDITDYGHPHASKFFDDFDQAIDPSHCARVPLAAVQTLCADCGIKLLKVEAEEFEIDVALYASHALPQHEIAERIDQIVEYGLNDPLISPFLYQKKNKIVFKNKAFRMLGEKF
jgi:ubiquinone/menaquinone biosynthesis C-methylase UbiE